MLALQDVSGFSSDIFPIIEPFVLTEESQASCKFQYATVAIITAIHGNIVGLFHCDIPVYTAALEKHFQTTISLTKHGRILKISEKDNLFQIFEIHKIDDTSLLQVRFR